MSEHTAVKEHTAGKERGILEARKIWLRVSSHPRTREYRLGFIEGVQEYFAGAKEPYERSK
jgi:hypothetical protein